VYSAVVYYLKVFRNNAVLTALSTYNNESAAGEMNVFEQF